MVSHFNGGRADYITFYLLSSFGLMGVEGALVGSVLAGICDEWRIHIAVIRGESRPRVVAGGTRPWMVSLRGVGAGILAFGVPWLLMVGDGVAADAVRGTAAGLAACVVPLGIEIASEGWRHYFRPRPRRYPRVDRRAHSNLGYWAFWRQEVRESWIVGYFVSSGVGICSVGIAALLYDCPAFGRIALCVYVGGRIILAIQEFLFRQDGTD